MITAQKTEEWEDADFRGYTQIIKIQGSEDRKRKTEVSLPALLRREPAGKLLEAYSRSILNSDS